MTLIGHSEKVLVMRVFIAVLVLIFSFQSWVLGEVKIDNLFGVKILDNIEKYSNKDKGEPHK